MDRHQELVGARINELIDLPHRRKVRGHVKLIRLGHIYLLVSEHWFVLPTNSKN